VQKYKVQPCPKAWIQDISKLQSDKKGFEEIKEKFVLSSCLNSYHDTRIRP